MSYHVTIIDNIVWSVSCGVCSWHFKGEIRWDMDNLEGRHFVMKCLPSPVSLSNQLFQELKAAMMAFTALSMENPRMLRTRS